VDLYGQDLPEDAIKAIRAATHMGNKKLAKVLAVMAAEAGAAQMEVA
jgi:DNA-binding transcriptional regulator YiaG